MRRIYVAITTGVLVLSSLPYLFGYLRQTSALRFTGIVFDVVDTAQYFAWMRSFSHQALIANPLTPDRGLDRFFNLQWWLLGLLAYHTPLGVVWTYQALRVVALVGFALALAAFCSRVAPGHRLLAFSMVMLSSGLGWLLLLAKYGLGRFWYPLDAQIGEANTFFSAMAFPHLLVAGGLTLIIFTLFIDAYRSDDRRLDSLDALLRPTRGLLIRCLVAGVLTCALGFSHGYDLIPLIVIPFGTVAALLVRRRDVRRFIWPGLAILCGAGPPALYVLALTHLDATWSGVLAQYGNAGVFTPAPPHLIILLGAPLLLALWQVRPSCWRTDDLGRIFVRVWLVLGLLLLYIPTNYQIKMLTAYQVPLGILAAETVHSLWLRRPQWVAQRRAVTSAVVAALVLLLVGTNLYLVSWRVLDLRRADYPYYLSAGDVRALREIGDVAEPGQVVLSSPDLGVFVPVYSDARPFVAHWAQTLDFYERRAEATEFYAPGTTTQRRQQILDQAGIAYVIAGPAEWALNDDTGDLQLPLVALLPGPTMVYRASMTIGQH